MDNNFNNMNENIDNNTETSTNTFVSTEQPNTYTNPEPSVAPVDTSVTDSLIDNGANRFIVQDKGLEKKVAVEEQIQKEKEKEEEKINKPKRKKFKIFTDIIVFIIFFIIILEAAIGFINMQKIQNEEEPVWYLSTKTIKTEKKTEKIYNLGLYKIVKTDTAKNTIIRLVPFFIGD